MKIRIKDIELVDVMCADIEHTLTPDIIFDFNRVLGTTDALLEVNYFSLSECNKGADSSMFVLNTARGKLLLNSNYFKSIEIE